MKSKNLHLNEDQVIHCVVDENDLPASVRNHLSTCIECQGEKQQIEHELNNLGHMAREFAPLPRRKVRLPFYKPRGLWSWRPAFVAGMAAVVLIAGIWRMSQIIRETQKDVQLMIETYAPEEYAIVDLYPDVSAEFDVGYFDEFLRFVSPFEANQNSV